MSEAVYETFIDQAMMKMPMVPDGLVDWKGMVVKPFLTRLLANKPDSPSANGPVPDHTPIHTHRYVVNPTNLIGRKTTKFITEKHREGAKGIVYLDYDKKKGHHISMSRVVDSDEDDPAAIAIQDAVATIGQDALPILQYIADVMQAVLVDGVRLKQISTDQAGIFGGTSAPFCIAAAASLPEVIDIVRQRFPIQPEPEIILETV